METQNVQRLLFGIEITLFGVILSLTGGAGLALLVGVIGLVVCVTGMAPQRRTA